MNVFSKFYEGLSAEERTVFKRQMAALFVVITLLNLGFFWQRAFREAASRRHAESVVRGWDGLAWYVWMPAAPATLLLLRRYPFLREKPALSVARLAAGSAVIYFVVTNTRFLLRMLPNLWLPDTLDRPFGWAVYVNTQVDRTPLDFLTYCGLFAASFAIDYYSKYRQRADEIIGLELRTARLQSELAGSQLAALRGQLHPHFLFNAFNAISTLVRQRKNDQAVEMIAHLGELLRFAMEKVDQPEVTLEQEIAFVSCYLNIERVRFGEKLRVSMDIEPRALGCVVPNLLLQPLVENAIKHGISKRVEPGVVQISARQDQGRLALEITDDGPGFSTVAAGAAGIGLKNTRSRLTHAYGADYRLEIGSRPEGGTVVSLDLPWRTAGASVEKLVEVST